MTHLTNIKVFSKPNCAYCVLAKALLASKNIEYVEVVIDIGQERDPDLTYIELAEFKAKNPTIKALPFILAGQTVIGGFKELQTLLALIPLSS